jgi:hypothetical protein
MSGDGQTVFDFGGNWHYNIFWPIVSWSKVIYFGGLAPQYFGVDCLKRDYGVCFTGWRII